MTSGTNRQNDCLSRQDQRPAEAGDLPGSAAPLSQAVQPPCERYYAAACQIDLPNPQSRDEIAERVGHMLRMVDFAVNGYAPFHDVKLVVFPEFAHAAPVYATAEELLRHLAVPIPNEHTDRYIEQAKSLGVYIQTGTFLECDQRWPGHVFNTTCLIGPEGILYKYRKVHPWVPWEVHTSPHDLAGYDEPLFPVADTPIGRLGAAICYDWLFPEAIRQLALQGADVLIRVSAYMDPWGTAAPLDWWTTINRTRALENMCYVVAANQSSSLRNYPPFSWPGGSMIVDFDGVVLRQAESGPGERIVVGPIDIAALRSERQRRRGHQLLAHLRMEAYRGYGHTVYPPEAGRSGPPTVQRNEEATKAGREALARLESSLRESSPPGQSGCCSPDRPT
jgi:predicted amidohydrolase